MVRMSELSRISGVSVPTIKYYLREGLLPSGEQTKANRASYSESHLTRLKLIAVMSGIARLSLAEIKIVLDELDGPGSVVDTMAVMQNALAGRPSREAEAFAEDSRRIPGGSSTPSSTTASGMSAATPPPTRPPSAPSPN